MLVLLTEGHTVILMLMLLAHWNAISLASAATIHSLSSGYMSTNWLSTHIRENIGDALQLLDRAFQHHACRWRRDCVAGKDCLNYAFELTCFICMIT